MQDLVRWSAGKVLGSIPGAGGQGANIPESWASYCYPKEEGVKYMGLKVWRYLSKGTIPPYHNIRE